MKTDSNAAGETEIILYNPILNSPRLGTPPALRSNPEVVVHTKTIRSLYPETLEIQFHSTDKPVLRVLLPRSAVYPRPILEMSELQLIMVILEDVHTVDLGTLHHKIHQPQLILEIQVRRQPTSRLSDS